jgi:hypothetical protein
VPVYSPTAQVGLCGENDSFLAYAVICSPSQATPLSQMITLMIRKAKAWSILQLQLLNNLPFLHVSNRQETLQHSTLDPRPSTGPRWLALVNQDAAYRRFEVENTARQLPTFKKRCTLITLKSASDSLKSCRAIVI